MSETPRPDLDQVRDALRRHDQRPTEDDEERDAPEPDVPAGEEQEEDEPGS
jgi:hypothetical protein